MPSLPAQFPDLPAPAEDERPWRQNVLKAYGIISEAFSRATQLLRQEDGDALRLRIHSEKIMQRMIPLLDALDSEVHDPNWTSVCTHVLAGVMVALEAAAFAADGMWVRCSLLCATS
jgi:hypothetical protein